MMMWQKIKSIYKIKTFYFKGRSIHLTVRTGINCENTIGIKYHYHKNDRFWNLWLMLWFIDFGFAYFWRKKDATED